MLLDNFLQYHTTKSPSLPYAADVESPLKPEELQVLRAQYEKEGEYVGLQTKFNYAWGLIKSNSRPDQQEGVRLLSEIFRNSRERRRECLYYLALGNYKLGNYAEARRYNELLLERGARQLAGRQLEGPDRREGGKGRSRWSSYCWRTGCCGWCGGEHDDEDQEAVMI
ncbi:hypothetical protein SNOG_05891 [Parastagonospora nodorum SN15]|uniref:Mitochondrial fission 1 protein n=1 Tax=Phaeosphaeria nodorum (strain SN15 / ATCC MYA-4574 / FGSC 10173) TaxID=321614 RepID=Q0UQS3_PHANO|nr:hypothetical protein SNOG_05891 [Parastagonospora nodorum SN15]EAT86955.2 hypothetical protein SNOG_05891 [Parastagonospora nodorum SN15]